MTPADAIEFFGSQKAIADVCEISEAAVSKWVRRNSIPYDKQCLLQLHAERVKGRKRRPLASRADERRAA